MAHTGFFSHDDLLRHVSEEYWHPENPDRLAAAWRGIEPYLDELVALKACAAGQDDLELIHTPRHVEYVRQRSSRGPDQLDPDTYVNRHSWHTACLATGGCIAVVDALAAGTIARGLALVRPPGHHATPSHAMGFCLLNHVAIAARHARVRCGIERVLIVDWDVHHGNGTQEAFYSDPSVAYFSVHQYPHFPGTGVATEVGANEGEGFTVNVPVPAGAGDAEFLGSMEALWPLWERADPSLVLVSTGFDAHARDRLANMEVTTAGFRQFAEAVLAHAHSLPVGFIMEGGYDSQALEEGWRVVADCCLAQ